MRAAMADKETLLNTAVKQAHGDLDGLRQQLASAQQQIEGIQRRKAAEMEHVEARVKAAFQKKDDTIAALRAQLAGAVQEMQSAEAELGR